MSNTVESIQHVGGTDVWNSLPVDVILDWKRVDGMGRLICYIPRGTCGFFLLNYQLNDSMEQGISWEATRFSHSQEIPHIFYKDTF
jgi:type 1 glutamine amidotransferase